MLSVVKGEQLVETLADAIADWEAETLKYTMGNVKAEAMIYTLAVSLMEADADTQ